MENENTWKLRWQAWPKWWRASRLLIYVSDSKSAWANSWSIVVQLRVMSEEQPRIWGKMTISRLNSSFTELCCRRETMLLLRWQSTLAGGYLNIMGGEKKKVYGFKATNSTITPTTWNISWERWTSLHSNLSYQIRTLIVLTGSWMSLICQQRMIWAV